MHEFKKLTAKNIGGENYYSIHYFDETADKIHIGFSSSSLDVISDFLKEFFIKNNDDTERHAHWIIGKNSIYDEYVDGKCSNCGYTDCFNENGFYNYCPECGARMDEVVSDDT